MMCKNGHSHDFFLVIEPGKEVSLVPYAGTYCLICFFIDHGIENYKVKDD